MPRDCAAGGAILRVLRGAAATARPGPGARRRPPRAARGSARGAQARQRPLRRRHRVDGGADEPRRRGGRGALRSGRRVHGRGGAPLGGHRDAGAGRWDHGAVRRARGPGGSRDPRVLRRAADAAAHHRIRRRRSAGPRDPDPDPRGPQLRRGRAAAPRLRSVGALRGGADRPPGVAPRAARQARHRAREHLHHRHDRTPRAHAGDRPRQHQGARPARRGVRGGRRRQLDAARGVGSPGAIAARRARG